MGYVLLGLLLALSFQVADHVYHRKNLSAIEFSSRNVSVHEFKTKFKGLAHKPLDNYFALLPFMWTYIYIFSAIFVFNSVDSLIVKIAMVFFVSGRFRSLQEIGHFAVHGTLCPNMKWGFFLANIFYQFPLFMPEARTRKEIHVKQHHHSINMPHDPDLKELLDKDLKPSITTSQFWKGVFYPLTWKGLRDRVKECGHNLWADHNSLNFYLRILVVSTIVGLFLVFQWYNALIFLYVIPVLTTYPLFYWLAHIALHRWFASCDPNLDYADRELALGRPTEFKGIIGFVIKHNIFPLGDCFHLAHSLFPGVRWNYLSQIDKILKEYCPRYSKNLSCNLIFSTGNKPSAISELKSRLVCK